MEIRERISINIGVEEIWMKIRDIQSLPRIFHEIDRIDIIDENIYNVWFSISIGPIKHKFQSIVTITKLVENRLVEFGIRNRHINVDCRIELEKWNEGTIIYFYLVTRPKNPLGRLVEKILMDKMSSYRKRLYNYFSSL